MSCSKYHYVKFLDEVEEITDSKTNDDEEKKNLIFSHSKMSSSIDSQLTNYLTYVSKIVSQLKDTKEENAKLKDENKKLKEELVITKNASDSYLDLLGGDEGTIDKIDKLKEKNEELVSENEEVWGKWEVLNEEHEELKEENDKLKLMTFEADTRCDGIKIKMNKNWLSEDIDPILNDRDHIKNYFDELNNLPDNLDYEIEFKEDMEEPFYRNLVGEIQGCLNSLKIFGGIHSGHNIDEMICETIHDFVNEALTDGDYFEIEVEEEEEEEEEESDDEEEEEEEEIEV